MHRKGLESCGAQSNVTVRFERKLAANQDKKSREVASHKARKKETHCDTDLEVSMQKINITEELDGTIL